jgi:hypothetical protein
MFNSSVQTQFYRENCVHFPGAVLEQSSSAALHKAVKESGDMRFWVIVKTMLNLLTRSSFGFRKEAFVRKASIELGGFSIGQQL